MARFRISRFLDLQHEPEPRILYGVQMKHDGRWVNVCRGTDSLLRDSESAAKDEMKRCRKESREDK